MRFYLSNLASSIDDHTLEVFKKSSASIFVKISGMIVAMVVSIYLGRTLGADGLGIINLSNRIISLALVFCLLGVRQALIKEVAIGNSKSDGRHIKAYMRAAYWINGGITLIVTCIFLLLTPWLSEEVFDEPSLKIPLAIAALVMVPQVFSRIFSSGLIGLKKIWQSSLIEDTLSMVFIAVVLFLMWWMNYQITVISVAIAYAIGRTLVSIIISIYWKNLVLFNEKTKIQFRSLLKTSLPLLLVSATSVVTSNADILMLGFFKNAEAVGLYSIASRLALITIFVLAITNSTVSPKIAVLFREGRIKELEKMLQKVTTVLLMIGLGQLLVYLFFGKAILGLWGSEFINAYWVLIILNIGLLFNLSTGVVGSVLAMSGKEKILGIATSIAMVANVILNFFLIQHFGAEGAAIASAATVLGVNIYIVHVIKRDIGIFLIPFTKYS